MSNDPKYSANMTLPKDAKQAWTNIMQGQAQPAVPDELNVGSPIVMAYAVFEDGTRVAGGVCKGMIPKITTSNSCGFLTQMVISIPAGQLM